LVNKFGKANTMLTKQTSRIAIILTREKWSISFPDLGIQVAASRSSLRLNRPWRLRLSPALRRWCRA
jgi:hypothetical protein